MTDDINDRIRQLSQAHRQAEEESKRQLAERSSTRASNLGAFETLAKRTIVPALEAIATTLKSEGHSAVVEYSPESLRPGKGAPRATVRLNVHLRRRGGGGDLLVFSCDGSDTLGAEVELEGANAISKLNLDRTLPDLRVSSATREEIDRVALVFVERVFDRGQK